MIRKSEETLAEVDGREGCPGSKCLEIACGLQTDGWDNAAQADSPQSRVRVSENALDL